MKTIVSVLGIRPDIIRCSELIRKFDKEFNHILVWTGQHYDRNLFSIFFEELGIRLPNYDLKMGLEFKTHHALSGMAGSKIIDMITSENIKPDAFFFLGDSNSVAAAMPLKKEYGSSVTIIHCEAGMRSYDKRMLEEINRTVCDHCSDIHFVYHENYKYKLIEENLPVKNIHVVGNTIVEVCNLYISDIITKEKTQEFILMDIHRPENFKYPQRLANIIEFGKYCSQYFELPIKMLKFARTMNYLLKYNISTSFINFVDLMSYKTFLQEQYDAKFLISDSGSAQEEAALLKTPVIVPRDYTERPESMEYDCSHLLDVNSLDCGIFQRAIDWIINKPKLDSSWLGNGNTSNIIVEVLRNI